MAEKKKTGKKGKVDQKKDFRIKSRREKKKSNFKGGGGNYSKRGD